MRRFSGLGLIVLVAGCGSPTTDDWLGQVKDPDVVKRRQAIRELGSRTSEAAKIVPALTEALRDESGYARHDAAMATEENRAAGSGALVEGENVGHRGRLQGSG